MRRRARQQGQPTALPTPGMDMEPARISRPFLLALLVPLLWLAVIRIALVPPATEIETDCYYHVMMGDLFPEVCVQKTFPYTTFSIWRDHFYDKELLFHGLLSGTRRLAQVFGLPLSPPFHLPALMLDFLLLLAFVLLLQRWKVPWPVLWSTLLATISPFFTYHLLMVRPHNLAITLMLFYCLHLGGVRAVRDLWKPACFGFLFVYAYSNPHLVLFPALAYGGILWIKKEKQMGLLLPLATLGGLIAGFTLHPQFPNTFLLWKIQSVDVILQAMGSKAPVYIGFELTAPDSAWLIKNVVTFVLLAINAQLFYMLARKKGPAKLPSETLLCLALQIWFSLNVLWIRRAMEYACPFSVLATALLWRDVVAAGLLKNVLPEVRRNATAAVASIIVLALALETWAQVNTLRTARFPEYRDFPKWAGKTLPDGITIANLHWSDFPQLFYGTPQFRYLMGLDPMFGYHAEPKRVGQLEKFRTGQIYLSPAELMALTDARFAFCSRNGFELARDMKKAGYVPVYEGPDGWLFDLEAGLIPKAD